MRWIDDKTKDYLAKGMHGAKVKMLQFILNELNQAKIKEDGYFGNNTLEAVLNFQKNFYKDIKEGVVDFNLIFSTLYFLVKNKKNPVVEEEKEKEIVDKFKVVDIIDELPRESYRFRDVEGINEIIIHHSGTNVHAGGSNPFGYANYHLSKGWGIISYSYVIQPLEKTIYKTLNYKDMGYHVSGRNTHTIGIVASGDYTATVPTQEIYDMVNQTIRLIEKDLGRKLKVSFHNQYSSKLCPGKNFKRDKIKE